MSTRAVITVSDVDDTFHVYRHCDGYPEDECGVLEGIRQAMVYAWPLPRFEAMDFAAACVAAWKRKGYLSPGHGSEDYPVQGGDIYLTKSIESHCDAAYLYDVSALAGVIRVKVTRPQFDWDTGILVRQTQIGQMHKLRATDTPPLQLREQDRDLDWERAIMTHSILRDVEPIQVRKRHRQLILAGAA